MNEATQKNTALTLPLAAMRDIAIYPKMTVSVDIGVMNPSLPYVLRCAVTATLSA